MLTYLRAKRFSWRLTSDTSPYEPLPRSLMSLKSFMERFSNETGFFDTTYRLVLGLEVVEAEVDVAMGRSGVAEYWSAAAICSCVRRGIFILAGQAYVVSPF